MPALRTSRRQVLAGSAALVLGMPFVRRSAAADAAVAFQLSWIKSIQYGGYFAGIETGTYAKLGIAPTFNSGGPNVDAVANVAAGQSQFGGPRIGPPTPAPDKRNPTQCI